MFIISTKGPVADPREGGSKGVMSTPGPINNHRWPLSAVNFNWCFLAPISEVSGSAAEVYSHQAKVSAFYESINESLQDLVMEHVCSTKACLHWVPDPLTPITDRACWSQISCMYSRMVCSLWVRCRCRSNIFIDFNLDLFRLIKMII